MDKNAKIKQNHQVKIPEVPQKIGNPQKTIFQYKGGMCTFFFDAPLLYDQVVQFLITTTL